VQRATLAGPGDSRVLIDILDIAKRADDNRNRYLFLQLGGKSAMAAALILQ